MKNIILYSLLSISSFYSFSQIKKILPPKGGEMRNDTLVLKEDAVAYQIVIEGARQSNLDIKYKTEKITADADDFKIDRQDINNTMKLTDKNEYKAYLPLIITHQTKSESTELFKLIIEYSVNGETDSYVLIIEIESDPGPVKENKKDKKSKKEEEEPILPGIMYLNAYNFDFGNTSSQSNYVGHLNVFASDLNKGNWGVNAGIMKINYSQNDSTINEQHVIENVLINPYETLVDNSKYLKQVNTYKTQRKNTIWSIYIQPLYRIGSDEDKSKSRIYAHGHFELVPSKWSSTTTISNIREDTSVFTNPPPRGFVARTILSKTSTYTMNGVYGYFGLGMTFDLKLWDNGSLFFQPTVGITTNFPQPSSLDINSTIFPNAKEPSKDNRWTKFYMFRAYFNQKVNNSATIVIGTDIRGLFPVYKPLYAVYAGLNLSLTKIVDLFTGE